MHLRNATTHDFPALLALNAEQVRFLSPLDAPRLAHLHAESVWHQVLESKAGVCAFLLAFAPGADYDSPNYRWFEARSGRFLYVDRIVVAASAQGQGCGRRLYEALFDFARKAGFEAVVCEYDLDPPNPVSAAFHARFGFVEIGRQMANGKHVSMQATNVDGIRG
jgi:predicted GNAT superfamily acetyltransferase